VTGGGGSFGEGVLFEIRGDDKVVTLVSFPRSNPLGDLVEGVDRNLYLISSRPDLLRISDRIVLRLSRTSGDLALTWPVEAEGYALEFTEAVSPTAWKPVMPPEPRRGFHMITNASAGSGHLYRLIRRE